MIDLFQGRIDVIRISPLFPFPTYSTYAADGGVVFGDEEQGPTQSVLAGTPGALAAPDEERGPTQATLTP